MQGRRGSYSLEGVGVLTYYSLADIAGINNLHLGQIKTQLSSALPTVATVLTQLFLAEKQLSDGCVKRLTQQAEVRIIKQLFQVMLLLPRVAWCVIEEVEKDA